MIDFELTDEQQLIRETARDFADGEIVPRARENDRNEHFDTELVEEIGRGCSAMRTVVSVVTSLVCSSIVRWGTEEQKQEWLPKLCSGEALGCFGLTEPDTGSDASNMKTRAAKIDGGWRLNGGKMWISLGNYAKLALIFAQTDPELKHRGIACFLVPTDSEGFSTQEIHGKLGLKGSDTAELSLDLSVAAEEHGFTGVMAADHFQPWVPAQGQASYVWNVLSALGQRTQAQRTRACARTSPSVAVTPSQVKAGWARTACTS